MTESLVELFELLLLLLVPTLILATCRYLNRRWDRSAGAGDVSATAGPDAANTVCDR